MKICVFTLGCKVNQYESDGIINELIKRGHEVTSELSFADVYVLNTCAVTSLAERKSRQLIARARKCNPLARIIVCGCASQKNPDAFANKDVELVIGNAGKLSIADRLDESGAVVSELPCRYETGFSARPERVRTYVKIQDGCNNFCSYCIVPYLRGRSRSRNIEEAVNEILSVSGEVVLTGVDISDFGKSEGKSLADLICALADFNGRLRLGSLEVRIIAEALLNALSSLRGFCPHFHLSLQSGSDGVLKAMNRHYTTDEYYDKVCLIRRYFPLAAITTDVIVGFPTETEAEFSESMAFLKKVQFADVHVFPYSKREGTRASSLPVLTPETVELRKDIALGIKDELKRAFCSKNLGKTLKVLVEEENDGFAVGYSENYVRVFLSGHKEVGQIYTVSPDSLFRDGVSAK